MQTEWLRRREIGLLPSKAWRPPSRPSYPLCPKQIISGLDHYAALEGHGGCVNTLAWNRCGSLLASGSDDGTIRLWTVNGTSLKCIHTAHDGNIFGVAFLPGTRDRHVISCSGGGSVIVHDIELSEGTARWEHEGRVKRLATTEDEPFSAYSISEDFQLRRHDARSDTSSTVLKTHSAGKTLAISERRPELIAVGCDASVVRIYDKRKMGKTVYALFPADKHNESNSYVTHLSFAQQSNHILVNYGNMLHATPDSRSSVYLFDLDNTADREGTTFLKQLQAIKSDTDVTLPGSDHEGKFIKEVNSRAADRLLKKHYMAYIDGYTEHIQGYGISSRERAMMLVKRAIGYTQRKWEGDTYAAARDYALAATIRRDSVHALLQLASALSTMEEYQLAKEVVDTFKARFPLLLEAVRTVEDVIDIGLTQTRQCNMRVTSSGRIDYAARYTGHLNESTDIKEASFFGPNEEFVVAGSDCGHIYVYDRKSQGIVTLLEADSSIVNCVTPHPHLPLIASSGIDEDANLWAAFSPLQLPRPRETSRRRPWDESGETVRSNSRRPRIFRDMIVLYTREQLEQLFAMAHAVREERRQPPPPPQDPQ